MAIYNQLKNENLIFGTEFPAGSSYIMNDGKFLDMRGSKNEILEQECIRKDIVTHPQFDYYVYNKGFIEEYTRRCLTITDNAIAINDGGNFRQECAYFILPASKPSTKQFTALEDWLTNLMTISSKVELMSIGVGRHIIREFVFKTLDNNEWLPSEIIREIKKMYN